MVPRDAEECNIQGFENILRWADISNCLSLWRMPMCVKAHGKVHSWQMLWERCLWQCNADPQNPQKNGDVKTGATPLLKLPLLPCPGAHASKKLPVLTVIAGQCSTDCWPKSHFHAHVWKRASAVNRSGDSTWSGDRSQQSGLKSCVREGEPWVPSRVP